MVTRNKPTATEYAEQKLVAKRLIFDACLITGDKIVEVRRWGYHKIMVITTKTIYIVDY